jgi:fatty acid desaturase
MNVLSFLSQDELHSLRARSDTVAVWRVAANYALIALGFGIFIVWPNPVTFLLGAMIQGGSILGLAVLNHDAAHMGLFKTRSLNRPVARWLLAGPSLGDYDSYKTGHLKHHRYAGTTDDPDIPFVQGYPTSAASMRRKFTRDLTGQTGVRDLLYLIKSSTLKKRLPFFISHAVLIALLMAAGSIWAYSQWWVGFIFVYPAVMRIRVMAEHGAVEQLIDDDPRRNTRTTLANPMERLFIAPNFVNFHCEHHVLAGISGHKLPELHRLLRDRGFYKEHPHAIEKGYLNVLKRCIGSPEDRPDIPVARGAASYADMS